MPPPDNGGGMWIDYFLEDENGQPIAVGRQYFPTWNVFLMFRDILKPIGICVPNAFRNQAFDKPLSIED